ncbi:DUF4391 domain-containing protein [Olsenella sp. kh2p3]|uniref:DUF4391 domain-containing protein n=1 Tax=Olsenella sp. kh2p3 TaxID=1797112 RepID=UPI0009151FC0|nr:DUF4391 domain-containing protein [Olsenella sp. kh2p3]SFX55765.1 protein of unknown function [Olsenella sp. kh2p3]
MLGLPSTTEVDRVLPKRAFYEHLQLDPATRRSFVDDIESLTVRNSIKPSTTGIPAGDVVQEVLVLEVALKGATVPKAALAAIARLNPHRLLFACTWDGKACLAVLLGNLVVGQWQDAGKLALGLDPIGMDQTWDRMASQVAYGDEGRAGETVEERHATDEKIERLKEQLAKVEARHRKEKQFARRNRLFDEVKALQEEIRQLEGGR